MINVKQLLNPLGLKNPVYVTAAVVVCALVLYCCFKKFRGQTGGGQPALVLFHMTGCGHCERMMPEWDKLADVDLGVRVEKVNGPENPPVCKKNNVNGFPTIIYFKDGDKMNSDSSNKVVFEGDRSVDGFVDFVHQQA